MIKEYIKINIKASAIYTEKDRILVASSSNRNKNVNLSILDPLRRKCHQLESFTGSKSFLLTKVRGTIFISIDNKLLLRDEDGSWETVVELDNPSNFFWHLTVSKDNTLYVQEYGEPPTGIYRSSNGEEWDLLITSNDIDKHARHFHSLAYDQYRDMLIATLGDGNCVRIAISCDDGKTWKPLYKGAWQVLPIVVLKDRLVFGMDSGIAKGGLLIWFPDEDRFETLHLKWTDNKVKLMQMSDLKLLSNGRWIAGLGTPQAVAASSNLLEWCPVYIVGFNDNFDQSIAISEGETIVSFITGENVISISKDDITKYLDRSTPVIHKHKAIVERLKGVTYILKRKLLI